jgi:surface polysaccharide O-acyltransferase-like enzyme
MELKRKHWIDNLRWVTVLLVLFYHVIYFYNNKGVFGGVGGFGAGPQYQDVLMYILYPWFMPLLFLLAGISARYSLDHRSGKEWFKSRTLKLLVPSTIGLLVFHWMTGYFNTHVGGTDVLADIPQPLKFFVWAVSGTGPLWFIQDLWLFSLLLLLFHKMVATEHLRDWCGKMAEGKYAIVWIVLLGVFFWLGERTLILHPRPESADGLYNLYKPFFYLIPFLMGYFIFSHNKVQETVKKFWIPLMAGAVVSGIALIVTTWGENNTSPEYLGSPLNCLYGWLMCLALMGWFHARFDCTNTFANYMTRSSFGIYIVHYLIIASLGSMMFFYTQLPPVAMYIILTIAVFTLSPLLYEGLRRIPLLRWCIFGENNPKRYSLSSPEGTKRTQC